MTTVDEINEVMQAFFYIRVSLYLDIAELQFEIHDRDLRNQELAKDRGAQIKGAIKQRCSSGRHILGGFTRLN